MDYVCATPTKVPTHTHTRSAPHLPLLLAPPVQPRGPAEPENRWLGPRKKTWPYSVAFDLLESSHSCPCRPPVTLSVSLGEWGCLRRRGSAVELRRHEQNEKEHPPCVSKDKVPHEVGPFTSVSACPE